jgi:hypothetical protein
VTRLPCNTRRSPARLNWLMGLFPPMSALILACVSAQLEVEPGGAASPTAPVPAAAPVATALQPDPQPPEASSSSDDASHATHAPSPTPAASLQGPGAAHSGHPEGAPPETGSQHSAAPHVQESSSSAPASAPNDSATKWTCPMHPQIIRVAPGKCPICGMQLKPLTPPPAQKSTP